jgi:hypothetical protein
MINGNSLTEFRYIKVKPQQIGKKKNQKDGKVICNEYQPSWNRILTKKNKCFTPDIQ